MKGKDTREKVIDWLNDMLDVDHDLIRDVFTREIDINPESMFQNSPLTYDKGGVKVATPISLMSGVFGGPITPIFEGDVIQRFE